MIIWVLPLDITQSKLPYANPTNKPTTHKANNAYAITSKKTLNKFLHQCLFIPPKTIFIKSCENNQFLTWPGLKADAFKKNFPDHTPFTDKGHMKRQNQVLWSTKEKVKEALDTVETNRDINPQIEQEIFNNLFGYVGQINPKYGKIYDYLNGKSPLRSIKGMKKSSFYMTVIQMLLYLLLSLTKDIKQRWNHSKRTLLIWKKWVSILNLISLTMWRQKQYKLNLNPRILASNWWNHTTIGLMQ